MSDPGAMTLTHVEQNPGLAVYERARQALADAVRVDEVMAVHDAAERLKLYARQARDHTLKADAMELQLRSERRLGELLRGAKEAGQFGQGAGFHAKRADGERLGTLTLAEAGINRKLSSKAQKLAEVPPAAFDAVLGRARDKIVAGSAVVVNPVKDLKTNDKKVMRAVREARLAAKQRALPQRRFGVIYGDPEWPFRTWSEAGKDRSAENHYPTSLVPVIASRDVGSIAADDCALFLWITRPMLPAGLLVMEAWGFEYVTCWDWDKVHIGLGYWNRDRSEILLLGTRGNVPCPAPGTQWDSLVTEARTTHSTKPQWAYDMIEAYFPNLPKIELNARTRRDGWDAWGFEAPEDDGADEHTESARELAADGALAVTQVGAPEAGEGHHAAQASPASLPTPPIEEAA